MNADDVLLLTEKDFWDCPMWVVAVLRELAFENKEMKAVVEAASIVDEIIEVLENPNTNCPNLSQWTNHIYDLKECLKELEAE